MKKPYSFTLVFSLIGTFGLISIADSQAAIDNKSAAAGMLAKLVQIRVPFVGKDQNFFAHTLWGTVLVSRHGEIDYVLAGCNDSQGEKCLTAPSVFKESLVKGNTKKIQGERISATRVGLVQKSGSMQRLPAYEQLNFGDIYPGIKLTLEAAAGNVEKVFTVSPKGDPKHIRLRLTGGKLKTNRHGELEIETANKDPVVFSRPLAYQEINGRRQEVQVAYRLISSHEYGFSLGPYDKTKPLVIDPVLVARNFGGSSLALDVQGNVYVAKTVNEPYKTSPRTDGQIVKFDPDLTGALAAVYFGGSNYDYLGKIALDAQGNVYVVGYSYSSDLPTTAGAYDQTHNGLTDVFVAKLTPDLGTVLASTFLGGSPYDFGRAIVVDEGSGDVVIAGEIGSKGSPSKPATTDFPTTPSAFDRTISGTCGATFRRTLCPTAAFVSRFDSNLSQLKASTLLDGASSETVYALAIAGDGDIYATGTTKSSTFPTTAGAYDTSFNGASGGAWYTTYYLFDPRGDVFVARLDPLLTTLKASSFLGGSGVEEAYTIALDSLGKVFVAGGTSSNDLPVTSGAFQTVAPGSNQAVIGRKDGFLAELDGNLTQLQAATYLGGGGADFASAVLIDRDAVLVGGGSGSGDFFTSTSGDYSAYPFVARLDGTLLSLIKGEVLPSLSSGAINDLKAATDGAVYAVTDAWVAKLGSVDLAISISDAPDPVAVGENLSYLVSVANYGPYQAQNVSVSFSLPDLAHFTFVSATSSQGNCNFTGTALNCNLTTLEANASAMIQVTVTPTQAGTLIMGAQVTSPEPDSDLTNNSANASTTVEGGNVGGGGNGGTPGAVDLVVLAVDSPDPAQVNTPVTYQLTVTNQGSAQANGVVLTHTFQDSIAVESIQSSQGNCSFSAQTLSCALGSLAPNASASAQIVVRYLADGGMTSFVEAIAQEGDINPDDNQVEVATEILAN
jgi:uncharacterized repeat protein (TIGR01451 family)